MASPQEVLEVAIPHLPDVTPEIRRTVAKRVIEALNANDFYFVFRRTPVLDKDDGQCPKCRCQLVHIAHGPSYENAEARIDWQRRRILQLEAEVEILKSRSHTTAPSP